MTAGFNTDPLMLSFTFDNHDSNYKVSHLKTVANSTINNKHTIVFAINYTDRINPVFWIVVTVYS